MGELFNRLVNEAKTRIREVTAAEADDRRRQGAVLIDVREADDFAKEHAAEAVGISRGVLELRIEERVPDLTAEIICYCGGGSRSALAADNLQRMGYANVRSLAGGFKAWKAAGLPTAT